MDELQEQVLRAAATDPDVDDEVFTILSRALKGRDPLTGGPLQPQPVPIRTPDLPMVPIDLADYRLPHQRSDFVDTEHGLHGLHGPDPDGFVAYTRGSYRHDELPHVIAWLTALYHAATPDPRVDDDFDEIDTAEDLAAAPAAHEVKLAPPTTAAATPAASGTTSAADAARRAAGTVTPPPGTTSRPTPTPPPSAAEGGPHRAPGASPDARPGRRPS